jgi:hypothetical protein
LFSHDIVPHLIHTPNPKRISGKAPAIVPVRPLPLAVT